jgi:hypothetical protein
MRTVSDKVKVELSMKGGRVAFRACVYTFSRHDEGGGSGEDT